RVEALAVAEIDEGLLDVRRNRLGDRLLDLDVVAAEEMAQNPRVTRLLEGLEGHRLADLRIADGLGETVDHRAGVGLVRERFLPERDRAQAGEGFAVELRPSEVFGLVGSMRREELATEELLVCLR